MQTPAQHHQAWVGRDRAHPASGLSASGRRRRAGWLLRLKSAGVVGMAVNPTNYGVTQFDAAAPLMRRLFWDTPRRLFGFTEV